ncbi:Uncharacterised protein [Legionella sainthelensi]|nr:Uncharacterised protein [Legionella sainthelensi]
MGFNPMIIALLMQQQSTIKIDRHYRVLTPKAVFITDFF